MLQVVPEICVNELHERELHFIYLFITCNWVDTRWQESLHVTLARTTKILL
jgi:hypothetical protein